MAQLVINQVPVSYPLNPIDIYFTVEKTFETNYTINYLLSCLKNPNSDFATFLKEKLKTNTFISVGFNNNKGDAGLTKFTLKLDEESFFIPLFIKEKIYDFFVQKNFLIGRSFINNLEVWEQKTSNSDHDEYVVWGLTIEKSANDYVLTIGLNSQDSIIHKKTLKDLGINESFVKRVLIGNRIYRVTKIKPEEALTGQPVLNKKLTKALLTSTIYGSPKFAFPNHYKLIMAFYDTYLKGQEVFSGLTVLASGLREVKPDERFVLPREGNLLEFADDKSEYDPYRGFSKYGPYKVPDDIAKAKFIFIFGNSDRDSANNLYKYFKYGYRHFPGLEAFSKVPFDVDKENSITFENFSDPLPEFRTKVANLKLNSDFKYLALYISPFSEETAGESEKKAYFEIKEELLKRNITSQVIESDKLKSQAVHFYLPNMAIAILAKLGGIPWKLKRQPENYLLLGYGDSRADSGGRKYIGNTVCFDNSGVFKALKCFEYSEENLQVNLQKAIVEHIAQNGEPSRLIIHYFKDWGSREDTKLERAFSYLNLKIPYIVLNINDNKARDYICFDLSYSGKIPISGTVVEIKKNKSYIMFNNERYSDDISTYKGDDKFPVKVKISASRGISLDEKSEISSLLDQVYQFTRLYWRSIKQKAVPVTIEYAKELSEKISFFTTKELPQSDVAQKSLWFI